MFEIIELNATDRDFAACFAIRLEVFVGEQNVPLEEERDDLDATARHFLARVAGEPMGTLRLIEKMPGVAKMTRVAVLQAGRGTGLGAALMRHAEAVCDAGVLLLDAQTHALGFYEKLGYEVVGEPFMEAGIAHLHMQKLRVHTRS